MAKCAKGNSKRIKEVEIAIVLCALLVLLAIALSSAREKSAVFDEGAHIPAGYTYVAFGDFRLNPEHPPFAKVLAGIPLLFLQPGADRSDPSWEKADEWMFGFKFLYEWNDADRLIFWARAPIALLSLLLGLCVYLCARDLYGRKAGYAALGLYVFNPDLLAHGQLVTTDLAVTCFLFIAVYTFYRTMHCVTARNVLLTGFAAGLALASKFSGAIIFPMFVLVGATFALSNTPISLLLFRERPAPHIIATRPGKFAAGAALIAATALIALVVLWAGYGFRYRISPDPQISTGWYSWLKRSDAVSMQTLRDLRLVPETYIYGFLHALVTVKERPAYLLGEYSLYGWWYYFPVTFLVKTPIPLILLVVLGFIFIKRYGAGSASEAMLLLPVGLYWTVVLTSAINIGHRHLLPIYPFLIVFAAKVARAFDSPRSTRLAVLCVLLLVWNVLETALVYPHFLAYFNEIAGGPSGGYRWLVDSNLDWGQDLKGLARYRREHPQDPFYLSYFGTASVDYYGIDAHFLPGGNLQVEQKTRSQEVVHFDEIPSGALVAISATNLSGVYLKRYRQALQRFRNMQPIDTIGYSIFIYRMP